jgi:putative ABC transport system permease protein
MLRQLIAEIRFYRARFLLVWFCLSVGFLAMLAQYTLRESSERFVDSRARDLLAADIAVASTQPFSEEQDRTLRTTLAPQRESMVIEFSSMVSGREHAVLAEVRAVDDHFPLYGKVELRDQPAGPPGELLRAGSTAIVSTDLLEQLGLRIGQSLRLGARDFVIGAVLDRDVGLSRSAFGLAPRVYIHVDQVAATGLLTFGSLATYRRLYAFDRVSPDIDFRARITRALPTASLFVQDPASTVRGLDRALRIFRQFTGLMVATVLLLSALAAFYLLQKYMRSQTKTACLRMLYGQRPLGVLGYYFTLVALQMLGALATALVAAVAIIEFWSPALLARLPEGVEINLTAATIFRLLLFALLGAAVLVAPLLLRLRLLRPRDLLETESPDLPLSAGRGAAGLYAVPLCGFVLATTEILRSLWLTTQYLLALLATGAIVLLLFPRLFRILATRAPTESRLSWALKGLTAQRFATQITLFTFSLVTFFLFAIPSLLVTVIEDLERPGVAPRPRYFVINIPEEATDALARFVSERGGKLQHLSPILLARVTKKNNEVVADDEEWTRFPVRLSYREGLSESEAIVRGPDISHTRFSPGGEPALISVEREYAERRELKLGDVLEYDIQGVTVPAKVTNFRAVEWDSFAPNFFVQFQPGVLEQFPKSFIAVIGQGDGSLASGFAYDLTRAFPGLSLIDVSQTVDRALEVTAQLSVPVRAIAGVCLVAGLLLLTLLLSESVFARAREINLLRLMGASRRQVASLLLMEQGLAVIVALTTSMALAFAAVAWLSHRWLKTEPVLAVLPAIAVSAGALCVLATSIVVWVYRTHGRKPRLDL